MTNYFTNTNTNKKTFDDLINEESTASHPFTNDHGNDGNNNNKKRTLTVDTLIDDTKKEDPEEAISAFSARLHYSSIKRPLPAEANNDNDDNSDGPSPRKKRRTAPTNKRSRVDDDKKKEDDDDDLDDGARMKKRQRIHHSVEGKAPAALIPTKKKEEEPGPTPVTTTATTTTPSDTTSSSQTNNKKKKKKTKAGKKKKTATKKKKKMTVAPSASAAPVDPSQNEKTWKDYNRDAFKGLGGATYPSVAAAPSVQSYIPNNTPLPPVVLENSILVVEYEETFFDAGQDWNALPKTEGWNIMVTKPSLVQSIVSNAKKLLKKFV